MQSIEISQRYHGVFLNYIEKKYSDIYDDLSHFILNLDQDQKKKLLPHCGSCFDITFENQIITISISEQPTAIFDGNDLSTYKTIKVSCNTGNLEKLSEFIRTALIYKPDEDRSLINIFTVNRHGYWNKSTQIRAQDLEHIFIPQCVKDSIIKSIESFQNSAERYHNFGRAHKLCYLLTGVAGSGKSSLIKAIAKRYNRPLFVITFSKRMDDDDLNDVFSNITSGSIILLEDIDAFFIDRETKDINVSFSAFINILDGALSPSNNTLMFMTANNPERMDSAMIRPGRVDKIIRFELPKRPEIKDAFMAMTTDPDVSKFDTFYDFIRSNQLCMAAIVDYLFRYPDEYLDHIDEIINHNKILIDLKNSKDGSMYK
jgi:chaperone BCS1